MVGAPFSIHTGLSGTGAEGHSLPNTLGHGTPDSSCAGLWAKSQGSLLSSCWGRGPSTPSPPPSILPGQDQLISASPARPSGLPLLASPTSRPASPPLRSLSLLPALPVFAAGAGPACQEPGLGTGEPQPSHCAAPTARAGELLLLDELGWHSHFLVRFFYIPKNKKKKPNKILLKPVKVAKRQQCALHGALLTKPGSS